MRLAEYSTTATAEQMTATIHGKKQLNPELATFMSSSYSMNIRIWTLKNSLSALKNINTWLADSGGC